jgi:hypothetical protein
MSLWAVWLFSVIAASWAGWLLAGRTEVATLLMGVVMAILSAVELLATPVGKGQRRMPAAMLATGIGLIIAGAFDRLDINRSEAHLDWVTGFVIGVALSGLLLLPVVLRDKFSSSGYRVGDFPQPQWDAVWISITVTAGALADNAVSYWYITHGVKAEPLVELGAVSLAVLTACGVVQFTRFGRLYLGRLVIGTACPALVVILLGMNKTLFFVTLPVLFWMLCISGGAYPLRRPSGTLTDGWLLLRHWAITMALVFVISQNISGSLMNRTVSNLVASHGLLAPLSEEAFTRLVERDSYLWYDELSREPSGSGRGSPKLYLAKRDRFSGMWRGDGGGERNKKGGNGLVRIPSNPGVVVAYRDGHARVVHVVRGSPAEKAGIARGWWVSLGNAADDSGRELQFAGPGQAARGVAGQAEKSKNVESRIDRETADPVGYLFFDEFHPAVISRLNEAFSQFRDAGITELVIDLRYNPGGNLSVVSHLANLISGNKHAGEVLFHVSHNPKYTDADHSARFKRHDSGIDLKRIFVLQSPDSCSASELLVVGLLRYLPVITIGEVSCGKPVGMYPLQYGDLHYLMLSFRSSDAKGMGFYNDGLVPDCLLKDDVGQSFRLGSKDDPMFNAAVEYMKTGQCSKLRLTQ